MNIPALSLPRIKRNEWFTDEVRTILQITQVYMELIRHEATAVNKELKKLYIKLEKGARGHKLEISIPFQKTRQKSNS